MSTTVMMVRETNENFSNLRANFFNKSNCSDLILVITDIGSTTTKRLEIHTHVLILCSASRYIESCLSSLINQQNLAHYNDVDALLQNKLKLKLEIDFSNGLSDEVVNLFFSLFYVNRFDTPHLEQEGLMKMIEYNILELYELACYFLFDSLVVYIEEYFLAGMCLSYFSPLFRFCVRTDPTNGQYQIIESKAHLFTRLLQWYQCCVDQNPSQSPSREVGTGYYIQNKETILGDFTRRILNIDECRVPRHDVLRFDSGNRTHLDHYHRICTGCLSSNRKHNTVNAYYYTDLGHLKKNYRNGSETFFFRIKRRVPSSRDSQPPRSTTNTIELTCLREYTDKRARHTQEENEDEDWLEAEEEMSKTYTTESRVTLLSRKRMNDVVDHTFNESDITRPTTISHFHLHKPKHCYDSQCDHCKLRKPVYVLILGVTLCKESESPQEEMSMNVDESTSYI